MRQNFVVLLGMAVVLMIAGGVGIGAGVAEQAKRERAQAERRARCAAVKKAGKHQCCLVCGRHGVIQRKVATGGKLETTTADVFLCEEHDKRSAQEAWDRDVVRRSGEQRVVMILGGVGVAAGGILLLVLLLTRRRWNRQLAETRAYRESREASPE